MKEMKPLLQDEEEKFYFLENKTNSNNGINLSKEKVTTLVLSVVVLWLMWYSFYPFYVGFKYYDEAHVSENLPS